MERDFPNSIDEITRTIYLSGVSPLSNLETEDSFKW